MSNQYVIDFTEHKANVKDPKWIKRFLELADIFASWSRDPSTKVGAVLVTSSCKVIGVGYNGMFSGMCDDALNASDDALNDTPFDTIRDFKLAHTVHAEINAFANKTVLRTNEDLYLFVSKPMCSECAKATVLQNIKGVYCSVTDDPTFNTRWNNDIAQAVLKNMNINYTTVTNKEVI